MNPPQYSLEEIKAFAYGHAMADLNKIGQGGDAPRIDGIDNLAHSCWRWTVPAVCAMLPTASGALTDYLLHGLLALEPHVAVESAIAMLTSDDPRRAALAGLFLQSIPARISDGIPVQPLALDRLAGTSREGLFSAIRQHEPVIQAIAAEVLVQRDDTDALSVLAAQAKSASPSVVHRCLSAIRRLSPASHTAAASGAVREHRRQLCRGVALGCLLAHEPLEVAHDAVSGFDHAYGPRLVIARALVYWHPDDALKLLARWSNVVTVAEEEIADNPLLAPHVDNISVNVAVDAAYELLKIEQHWPAPTSADRMQVVQHWNERLIAHRWGNIRSSALVNLAELNWPIWRRRTRLMLEDRDEMARCEAINLCDEKGLEIPEEILATFFRDGRRTVRERGFAFWVRHADDRRDLLPALQAAAETSSEHGRHVLQLVRRLGEPEGIEIALEIHGDRDPGVRAEALRTIAQFDPASGREIAGRRLRDRQVPVKIAAIEVLSAAGDTSKIDAICAALADPTAAVRQAALDAACQLAPQRAGQFAADLVTDPEESIAKAALARVEASLDRDECVERILGRLRRAKGESGGVLLDWLMKAAPQRRAEIVPAASASRSAVARQRAADMIGESRAADHAPLLPKLCHDRSESVRRAAVSAVNKTFSPEDARPLLIEALRDSNWATRRDAVDALAKDDSPVVLEALLPSARDSDEDVRRSAITALARFDDVRVFSELVSSLNDVHHSVQEMAREILDGKRGPVPSRDRLALRFGEGFWRRIGDRVAAINRWAVAIGTELLGRPVVVHNYRQGLGRTWRRGGTVQILVSDTPVTSGHPHGEDVMRGLALHEIGHHVCDVGVRGDRVTRGIARSEGVGHVFDILRDERLERVMRAWRPEWGRYFDRLASYAFAQDLNIIPLATMAEWTEQTVDEVRAAIERGDLPGRLVEGRPGTEGPCVAIRDSELIVVPGAVPVSAAFLACLRCGLDARRHPDPRVAKAVGLVPKNLKDLAHGDLLVIARQIVEVLEELRSFDKDLAHFRRWILRHAGSLGGLGRALSRLDAAGTLPGERDREAADIRSTPIDASLPPDPAPLPGGRGLNLGKGIAYDRLKEEESIARDPAAHARLVAPIRKHIRRLRAYLEQLGRREIEEFAMRRGRRLDVARVSAAVLRRSPDMLVASREVIRPDAYLGVLVDRSGSMSGEKLDRAKSFAALIAESAKGLSGISGHVNAFDDRVFVRLGDLAHTSIASLESRGGNNDSGGLTRAAELAQQSKKKNKLLVMISDGSPTECTFESLKALVAELTRRRGIVCVQVAVDRIEHIAFPEFVDLSSFSAEEALTRFGRMLVRLTAAWR